MSARGVVTKRSARAARGKFVLSSPLTALAALFVSMHPLRPLRRRRALEPVEGGKIAYIQPSSAGGVGACCVVKSGIVQRRDICEAAE